MGKEKSDLAALCDSFEFADGDSSSSPSILESTTGFKFTAQTSTQFKSTNQDLTFQGISPTSAKDSVASSTPTPVDPEPETTDDPDTPSGLSPAAKGGIGAGAAVTVLGILLILLYSAGSARKERLLQVKPRLSWKRTRSRAGLRCQEWLS